MAQALKTVVAIFGLAFCVLGPAAAQDVENIDDLLHQIEADRKAQPVSADAPAMWRVSDEDSDYYVLGSFHILPPDLEWRTDTLDAAVRAADAVYFEVEADTPDARARTLNIMMMQGYNPGGKVLTNMLDETDATAFRLILQELGLPLASIDPMRPWQAFLTLSVQFIISQGFEPGAGVDSVLLSETRTLGKELRFFETLEEQIGLFTGLDPQTEKDLLVFTIRDWGDQKRGFDALFNAWRTGDVAAMDEEMNAVMRADAPVVYERLIVERNQQWAERLDADMRADDKTALVIVGAGHLAGPDALPALMRARGFSVERLAIVSAE
ncbi:MAG: TraB/GumN family protein [Pseudomonadota bacterium]